MRVIVAVENKDCIDGHRHPPPSRRGVSRTRASSHGMDVPDHSPPRGRRAAQRSPFPNSGPRDSSFSKDQIQGYWDPSIRILQNSTCMDSFLSQR